jgi:hypothetical protein
MFLIRVAFWLLLIVLLLPTDARQQARLYGAAAAALERASTFCERNGKVCAAAAALWATFLKKAEFGAHLAIDLISAPGKDADQQLPLEPTQARGRAQPKPLGAPKGTLTPGDLTPAWRGAGATRS